MLSIESAGICWRLPTSCQWLVETTGIFQRLPAFARDCLVLTRTRAFFDSDLHNHYTLLFSSMVLVEVNHDEDFGFCQTIENITIEAVQSIRSPLNDRINAA